MKSKSFRILILTVAVLIIVGGFFVVQEFSQKAQAAESAVYPPENVQKNSGQTTTTKIEWQWSASDFRV